MNRLRKLGRLMLSLLPSLLPTGPEALDKFCIDIIALGEWPDNPSFRHAIAQMIMHLGPETIYKSKFYFYKATRSSITKQTAYQLITDLKEQQKKAKDGEQETAKVNGALES